MVPQPRSGVKLSRMLGRRRWFTLAMASLIISGALTLLIVAIVRSADSGDTSSTVASAQTSVAPPSTSSAQAAGSSSPSVTIPGEPGYVSVDYVPPCSGSSAEPFVAGQAAGYDWDTDGLRFASTGTIIIQSDEQSNGGKLEAVKPAHIRTAVNRLLQNPTVSAVEVLHLDDDRQRLMAIFRGAGDLDAVRVALYCPKTY